MLRLTEKRVSKCGCKSTFGVQTTRERRTSNTGGIDIIMCKSWYIIIVRRRARGEEEQANSIGETSHVIFFDNALAR
jgi:Holliday junction resolvase-like predicted endonuclease